MTKYYGLVDLQLDGFKGGYAHTDKEKLIFMSAERVVDLAENDEEPPQLVDGTIEEALDVLAIYGYEIQEITKEEYDEILENDDLLFLSEVV